MDQDQAIPQIDALRLCIVNEFFYPENTGGTGTVLSDLARTMRRNHPDVTIDVITSRNLYRDKNRRLPKADNWDGIDICRLDTPHHGGCSPIRRLAINVMFGLSAVWTLLKRRRYDLVLVSTSPPTLAMTAYLLNRLKRTRYFYVVYDLDPDRAITMRVLKAGSALARVLRFAQKRWLHGADKVIVLGRCMQEHLADAYGLPDGKTAVIPIGANSEQIVPGSKESRFRQQHRLTGFLVAYSGNFGRYHDFDTILDAAKMLNDRGSDITFVLCGEGAQKARIQRRVAEEKIENVRMLPFAARPDYADALASANVSLVTLEAGMEGLCVPSKFYSILASGRPVVAVVSPISEVARVIEEDRCGIQVDYGDTNGLIEAISYLATHPAAADQMGEEARRTLVENYSTHRIADLYYELMRPSRLNPSDKVFTTAGDPS